MWRKLKEKGTLLKRELHVYQAVLRDHRTPKIAKWFLGAAIGYIFLPFDIIPDFIPLLGHLDDVIIVPLLFIVALRLIPPEIIEEHRMRLKETT